MENLKVIIADNSFEHAKLVMRILKSNGIASFQIVDNLESLNQVLNSNHHHDLLLINHNTDGLNLTKLLKDINIFKLRFKAIILFTDILNHVLLSHFYLLGIDYIINKNQVNNDLANVIKILFEQKYSNFSSPKLDLSKNLLLRNKIRDRLDQLNLPQKLAGYNYLVSAIELVYNNNNLGYAATKQLYPMIADYHNSNGPRIERSIRHILKKVDQRNRKYYKLSNLEFIFKIVEELKRT